MPRSDTRLTFAGARRGFTLPEILIVIVMISVLALVAIPRFANINGKRNMESARMRIASALATARAAAIQKGQPVQFRLLDNRVTVRLVGTSGSAANLMSPIPLDTLYNVTVDYSQIVGGNPLMIDFSARGFANLGGTTVIPLSRPNVPNDSVVVTLTGMVKR